MRRGKLEKKADKPAERAVDERTRPRLDTPRELRRPLLRRRSSEEDRFGVFAERFARFMGTAKFLIWMTVFVVVWIGWNTMAPADLRFDKYAFIFLTLMLSLQASYAAPLILLAQNRQEMRDRVIAEQDRRADAASHADMEFLAREVAALRMALGDVATRDFVRSELRALLAELEPEEPEDDPDHETEGDPGKDPADGSEGNAGGGAADTVTRDDPDHPGTRPSGD